MKKNVFIWVISALLVCACSDSSNDNALDCDSETGSCDSGNASECTNDTWKCDGSILSKCVAGKWEIRQTCEDNAQCSADKGQCEPRDASECTNDTWKCDGSILSKCVAGKWEIRQTCEDNAQCSVEKGACEEIESPVTECKASEHLFAEACEADDLKHCGTHSNDCTQIRGWETGQCAGKVCLAETCTTGYHLESMFDENHVEITVCAEDTHDACGSVNTRCNADEICSQGECQDNCQPGEVNCDGSCINPMSSRHFCGADTSCGSYISCSEYEDCIRGKCVLTSCQKAEESLCTENERILCVDVHGDNANHCGECGVVCQDKELAETDGCHQGQCIYICKDGMAN